MNGTAWLVLLAAIGAGFVVGYYVLPARDVQPDVDDSGLADGVISYTSQLMGPGY